MIFAFLVGGAVLAFVGAIVIYNGLVGKKNAIEEAFSGIDVQLKKRYDLIPNLVDAAKTYMQHEKSLLENIVSLRNRAMGAPSGSAQSIQANAEISSALRGFSVALENYPQLRSVESFNLLQRSLNEVEEQLSAARRTYNSAVVDYNNALEQIPSSFFAKAMGYQRKVLLESSPAERGNVSVGKLFQ